MGVILFWILDGESSFVVSIPRAGFIYLKDRRSFAIAREHPSFYFSVRVSLLASVGGYGVYTSG
jgi:hypothetical protein